MDLVLVVGSPHSANTRRLSQLCREEGTPTYQVETADEIQSAWLEGVERVGVTGGASTPAEVIEEVVQRLGELDT